MLWKRWKMRKLLLFFITVFLDNQDFICYLYAACLPRFYHYEKGSRVHC